MKDLYEKYMTLAEKLKIPETQILDWVESRVKDNNDRLRDERAGKREEKAKDRQLELEKKKLDLEIATRRSTAKSTVGPPKLKLAQLTPSEHQNIDL